MTTKGKNNFKIKNKTQNKTKNKIKWLIFAIFSLLIIGSCAIGYRIFKKSRTPKLSVVIPVYNVSRYLSKCLDTLIEQTFTDLEIICVNDGSTDNCLEILNDYKQKDNRISVIDKPNGGVSSARNAGLKVCHHDYVTFVDPDDYLSTDVYEKCMNVIKDKNPDILVFDCISEPENKVCFNLKDKFITDTFEGISDSSINSGYVWNKVFKRSILVDSDIWFDESISYAEDNLFLNMALLKSKTFATCPDTFYHYQVHPDSSGCSVPREKILIDAITRSNSLVDFYIKEGYTEHKYMVWLLDFCLAITRERIEEFEEPQKRKYYSSAILEILDGKLLPLIHDTFPEYLTIIMDKLRTYTYV